MHSHARYVFIHSLAFVILGLVLVFLLLWGIDSRIIYPTFQHLENLRAVEDADRVQSAIQSEVESLGSLANDWANWDDTYIFAQDFNQSYLDSNYPDPLLVSCHAISVG